MPLYVSHVLPKDWVLLSDYDKFRMCQKLLIGMLQFFQLTHDVLCGHFSKNYHRENLAPIDFCILTI